MKQLILILITIILLSCQSEEQRENGHIKNMIAENAAIKVKKNSTLGKAERNKVLDSLNIVYFEKGYSDFCVLKADLDSVFLTANYMAEIVLNGDVSSKQYTTLVERIEGDRLNDYYKKNNLERKKVVSDLILLAMEYPNPCEEYVNSKYRMVKEYLRTKHSRQLYQEAYRKYK